MTSQRIVVAGASGFIGRRLVESFRADGATVSVIGRGAADARWGDRAGIARLVDGADLLVNLAGKSVNCRYTAANRAAILRSRVDTTTELSRAVREAASPPPLWINASTATIYRDADDRAMTEADGEIGSGFSVDVATAWERALFADDLPDTRRVALRIAIVLGDGGALTPLLWLARFGLGGPQLDGRWPRSRSRRAAGTGHRFTTPHGRQRFSWIHLDDVIGIVRFLRDHPELDGAVNVTSPSPTDNRGFMRTLRHVLGMPIGLPAPRWLLEIGMFLLRTESELVLKSRWALPERLLQAGYRFEHPTLDPALRDIVQARGLPAGPRSR
jgi:NAD dependent epimerase/dehydratase family enzyme